MASFTSPSKASLAFIALVLCNLIFGASSVVYKIGLGSTPPVILFFYRLLFATPILAGISAGVDRAVPDSSHYFWTFAVGFTLWITQMGYIYTVYYAGAALTSVLGLANTPAIAALAIVMGMEKLSFFKGAGLLCAVGGAAVMVLAGHPGAASLNRNLGIGLGLFQTATNALWILMSKKYLLPHLTSTVVSAGMHISSLPFMAMLAFSMFGYPEPGGWDSFNLDSTGWLVVGFAFFFHSVLAFLCFNFATAHLDPSIIATFGTLAPLFGTICGIIILGEQLSIADFIGGFLILAGLAFVIYQRYRDSKQPPPSSDDDSVSSKESPSEAEDVENPPSSDPNTEEELSVHPGQEESDKSIN